MTCIRQKAKGKVTHAGVRSHARAAFSLIEVLVVVAIIIVLVAIAIAGINIAYQRSEEGATRALLGNLAGVEKEYRAQTGQAIPASANGDLDSDTDRFLYIVQDGSSACREMLRRLPASTITLGSIAGSQGVTAVKDPWDKLVRYNDGSGGSSMPKAPYPYFASAGADGNWGSYTSDDPNQPNAAAKDNLFSFEVK